MNPYAKIAVVNALTNKSASLNDPDTWKQLFHRSSIPHLPEDSMRTGIGGGLIGGVLGMLPGNSGFQHGALRGAATGIGGQLGSTGGHFLGELIHTLLNKAHMGRAVQVGLQSAGGRIGQFAGDVAGSLAGYNLVGDKKPDGVKAAAMWKLLANKATNFFTHRPAQVFNRAKQIGSNLTSGNSGFREAFRTGTAASPAAAEAQKAFQASRTAYKGGLQDHAQALSELPGWQRFAYGAKDYAIPTLMGGYVANPIQSAVGGAASGVIDSMMHTKQRAVQGVQDFMGQQLGQMSTGDRLGLGWNFVTNPDQFQGQIRDMLSKYSA